MLYITSPETGTFLKPHGIKKETKMPKKTIRDHTTENDVDEENNENGSGTVDELENETSGKTTSAPNESDDEENSEPQSDEENADDDENQESENSDDEENDEDESPDSDIGKWKKDARKWETRSKQNLKDLEEANDKIKILNDQLEQANTSLISTQKKSILMEYGLTEDHADFVTGSVDEMNDKAKRLSDLASAKTVGNRTQGTGENANSDPFKSYAESLGSI